MVVRAVANTKNHKQIFSFDGENEDNSWTGHAHEKHDINGPYHVSFETAIEFHEQLLRISVDAMDRAGEGREYCNLGKIHHSFGNFERATEYQNLTSPRNWATELVKDAHTAIWETLFEILVTLSVL